MALTLLVARLVLAAVFLVSGGAKLLDRRGSRQAIQDFGLPAALAAPFGILLPCVELIVAATLLIRRIAWYGALSALLLLLLFIAGIGINMARGRAPDCHCFGQLHSEPIGWRTLVRNGLLAAVAGFVAWQGHTDAGLSVTGWLGDRTGFERVVIVGGIAGLALLIGEGWMLLHVLTQHGRLLLRIDALEASGGAPALAAPAPSAGLPIGAPAPVFSLTGLYGETLTLDALRAAGKPTLLLFTDPNCGPCNALLPMIGRWQREMALTMTLTLISRGTPEANRAKSMEHGLTLVLLQQNREVAEAYQATATPAAVLVRPDGTIGSAAAIGADEIAQLVARTTDTPMALPTPTALPIPAAQPNGPCPNCGQQHEQAAGPVAVGIGERAPTIRLPNLAGKTITLDSFRGSDTLVLFWNPGCGFCSGMLDDLKAWEARAPKGAPKMLVVSTGDVEANRAMGLRATVVLDPNFSVGSSFGVTGTPSAILVDAKGAIASPIAVGKDAVLALAGAGQDQTQSISR